MAEVMVSKAMFREILERIMLRIAEKLVFQTGHWSRYVKYCVIGG
jgi:hypothetical protein